MGGQNELTLKKDDATKAASPSLDGSPGALLRPDVLPVVTAPPHANQPYYNPPIQTQAIRQHLSGGQVHLHLDEQKIKVAIPVAEWDVIMRNLKSMNQFTFIDSENKAVAYFKPFISNGVFEVTVDVCAIQIGNRIQEMTSVTGKR